MSGGFLNQFSPLLFFPPSVSPHCFKGWVTGLPAIILSTTELPYSTVTKQGAHSSVIPTHFPPLLMLLLFLFLFFFSLFPSAPIILSQYESCKVGEKYLQANGQFSVENIYTSLSTIFCKTLFTKIQTFWSCFILKYRNTNPQQCWMFFVKVSFNNLQYMLIILHHIIFFCASL